MEFLRRMRNRYDGPFCDVRQCRVNFQRGCCDRQGSETACGDLRSFTFFANSLNSIVANALNISIKHFLLLQVWIFIQRSKLFPKTLDSNVFHEKLDYKNIPKLKSFYKTLDYRTGNYRRGNLNLYKAG